MSKLSTLTVVTETVALLLGATQAQPEMAPHIPAKAPECLACHLCGQPVGEEPCLRRCPYASGLDAGVPTIVMTSEIYRTRRQLTRVSHQNAGNVATAAPVSSAKIR